MTRWVGILMLGLAVVCNTASAAEDATPNDAQAKEQAAVDALVKANEMTLLNGTLLIAADEENQKALKPVGALTVGKDAYTVFLMRDDQYKILKEFDKQKASVVGYVADKPDVGKVFYFDHIELEAPMAPSKRKRGGF